VSQARFGISIEHIHNESLGQGLTTPQLSLGYLWTQPAASNDPTGLGGSITWQWDERLCDTLVFDENFWAIPLVSCASVKASMHRAFDTWASNSRHVKFTDVSDQCAAEGYATTRCPHAEIWVTSIGSLDNVDHVIAPLVSMQDPSFTYSFRFTNGQRHTRLLDSGAEVAQQMVGVTGGTLAFQTDGFCWYLDSEFCGSFHRFKAYWDSPGAARAVGVTLFFSIWLSAVLAMLAATCITARWTMHRHVKIGAEAEHDEGGPVAPSSGVERLCAVLASFTIVGNALRILLLVCIFPYYTAIFVTCWSCYDFEAGAAHEIGHLLGLGHPELAPYETNAGYTPEGTNSYHEGLAAGEAFNGSTCLLPWAGVRVGAPTGRHEVRPSIMIDFTLHNPRHCLEEDDLEALNVLYPDCAGGPTVPVCDKPPLNLGWLRMLLIFCVFVLTLLVAALANCLARRKLRMIATDDKYCCPWFGDDERPGKKKVPKEAAERADEQEAT